MSLNTSSIRNQKTIGILGGGQLARYLAEKGQNLGHKIIVLSDSEHDPAAQICKYWKKGSAQSSKLQRWLLNQCDVVTFESEFFDISEKILTPNLIRKIFPKLSDIHIFQDRWYQKSTLENFDLTTSPFIRIDSVDDVKMAQSIFGNKFVIKKRVGGYDGYGTFVVQSKKQLSKALQMTTFTRNCIAEAFINFDHECAATFFRNQKGQIQHTPLVFSKQTHSKCDYVMGPYSHSNFSSMKKKIYAFLNQLDFIGTLTFEFFVVGNKLIINETAPRVHNSAHYSLNALNTDQFTLHIKSILNLDLPKKIEMTCRSFVMTNLVGKQQSQVLFPKAISGQIYWYGKTENRKGRKMGHINYVSNAVDSRSLLRTALKERSKIKL